MALAARPLGLSELAGFQWRTRAGHPLFKLARAAEAKNDWAAVAAACTHALAADATNLEAAWLLAVANAKLGKLDAIAAPLALAGTGDFGKWAIASLEQPALQPYLATPDGLAWKARVEADRAVFAAALAHAIIVNAKGDLFAYGDARWYRLTRTFGGVTAAFTTDGVHIAYVTHGAKSHKLAVGSVDLSTGSTTRPQLLSPTTTRLAYSAIGFWIAQPPGKPRILSLAADARQGLLVATTATRPGGPWLEVTASGSARVHRTPPNITADWDDQGLASAIKLGTSNRVVTVPGQIAGDTLVWSHDRAHVVFVAQIADHCEPGTPTVAAYAIDTATGASTELLRASHGLAVDWVGDRSIAIAGDDGVVIKNLGEPGTQPLIGATKLITPRFAPRCDPNLTDPGDGPVVEPDETDDSGSDT